VFFTGTLYCNHKQLTSIFVCAYLYILTICAATVVFHFVVSSWSVAADLSQRAAGHGEVCDSWCSKMVEHRNALSGGNYVCILPWAVAWCWSLRSVWKQEGLTFRSLRAVSDRISHDDICGLLVFVGARLRETGFGHWAFGYSHLLRLIGAMIVYQSVLTNPFIGFENFAVIFPWCLVLKESGVNGVYLRVVCANHSVNRCGQRLEWMRFTIVIAHDNMRCGDYHYV